MNSIERRLLCRVERLTYDVANRTGELYLPEPDCCDMAGCVALFEGIDPGARVVNVYVGGVPDVMYVRADVDWEAYFPPAAV